MGVLQKMKENKSVMEDVPVRRGGQRLAKTQLPNVPDV
jgi:hypothetical protein